MKRTRKKQKENDCVPETNSSQPTAKRTRTRKTVTPETPEVHNKTTSKYFNKTAKAPLTPLPNDTVKAGVRKKAVKSSTTSGLVSGDDSEHYKGCSQSQPRQNCELSENNTTDTFKQDLLNTGLQKSRKEYKLNVFRPVAHRSKNMLHHFEQLSLGIRGRLELQKSIQQPIVQLYTDLEVYRVASPFDRRVTALEWHPTRSNILAIGSKGGDIILWNVDTYGKEKQINGVGAAGSCQAMKFWPWDLDKMVSASINGTVTLHDFDAQANTTLADTMDSYDHWYCSLDINRHRNMVVAGRNHGILHIMSPEGRKIFEERLHKNKITHVEFSPREEWLLCTASTDATVQLWDVRNIRDRKSALHTLKHEKPVNSAYFSLTDGCRLVTTDQGSEIRVYRSPSWHLETTIAHPHRFFQHITPFKATWHPLQDLIVCGRYPDKNFGSQNEPRSIDLFDAGTGEMVSQLRDPSASGLCCLNKFNRQGDALASGMGFHTLLWNRKEGLQEKHQQLAKNFMSSEYGYLAAELPPNTNRRTGARGGAQSGARSGTQSRSRRTRDDDIADQKKKKKRGSKTAERTDTNNSVVLKSKTKMSKKEK